MTRTRLYVVAAVVVGIAALTAVVLSELFGTVVFALTVAYVLTPVHGWFVDRGLSRWWASAMATTLASVGTLLALSPIGILLLRRRGHLIDTLRQVPDRISVEVLDVTATITLEEVVETAVSAIPSVALDVSVTVSSLAIKFGLFGVIVFGLLIGREEARRAMLAPVPPGYRDVVRTLELRARETIVAILVLQVGTAAGTFLVAVPLFHLLGYQYPFVLGTIAGFLQFLPIIGPSLLIGALAVFHFAVGELLAALTVLVVGGIVIGWLPDMLIRPRIARWSAGLPGSLYLIGFIGGLTSLGTVGIIAGPVVVALLVEAVELLAAEMDHTGRSAPAEGPAG